MSSTRTPIPQSDLTFNDQGIKNISKMVFKGMQSVQIKPSDKLTKDDMRAWTKTILSKRYPDAEFSEETFEKGFRRFDTNGDGNIYFENIKKIVELKVKRSHLYVKT